MLHAFALKSPATDPVAAPRPALRASRAFGDRIDRPPVEGLGHHLGRIGIPRTRSCGTGVHPIQTKTLGAPSSRPRLAGDAGSTRMLPESFRSRMERAFGHDFSTVRIHQGSRAGAIDALAYTQGADIHFAPGRYDPTSREGQRLLGHELTHVVQQRSGRVAMPRGAGLPINDHPRLEAEADRTAERVASGLPSNVQTTGRREPTAPPAPLAARPAIQCSNGKGKGATLKKKKELRIKAEKAVRSDMFHVPSGESKPPPEGYTTWHEFFAKQREDEQKQ
jgi:hypothetical protein